MSAMTKDFEIEVLGLGNADGNYPGEFTQPVKDIINYTIKDAKQVLHLFSGISTIGQVRVDLECPQATDKKDVIDFIKADTRYWDFIVLDPPYEIHRKSKIEEYARASSVAADVSFRRKLQDYFQSHTDNILWLDMCAPLPKGFKRKKLWFLFPGAYHTIRILSWLTKYQSPLL